MQSKPATRLHELRPNAKPSPERHSPYHSLQKSQGNTRNPSLQVDPHQDDGRLKKQLIRLRGKVSELQKENMELQKLKIEQEAELTVWVEKTRRLTDQLRLTQEKHFNAQNCQNAPDQFLRKQMKILQEQVKQLAISKTQLEEELIMEKEKRRVLEHRVRQTEQESGIVQQLELKLAEREQLLTKTRSAYERSEVKGTRNEVYIGQLQAEIHSLEEQLCNEIVRLQEEKSTSISQAKSESMRQLANLRQALEEERHRNSEFKIKIEEIEQSYRRTKEEIQSKTQQFEAQSDKRRDLLNSFEQLQRDFQALRQENQQLRNQPAKEPPYQQNHQAELYQSKEQQSQLEELTVKLSKKQAALRECQSKIREQDRRMAEMQAQAKQQATKIGQLQAKNKQQIEKISEQSHQIRDQFEKIHEQSRKNQQMGIQLERMSVQIVRNDKENDKYRSKNQQLTFRVVELENQLNSRTKQMPLQRKLFRQEHEEDKPKSRRQSLVNFQESALRAQLSALEKKLKDQRLQGQQLMYELEKSHQEQLQLGHELREALAFKNEVLMLEQKNVELLRKIRDQEAMVVEMRAQNERWKSYRLSQEDEARREARRYKKRVEELEMQLEKEKQESIRLLEQAQLSCDSLRHATASKEQTHLAELERQKDLRGKAIDEMEAEFKKLLDECEHKLQDKQKQIQQHRYLIDRKDQAIHQKQQESIQKQKQLDLKQLQVQQLTATINQERALTRQYALEKEATMTLVHQLEKELAHTKTELQRLRGTNKRDSDSARSTAIAEAQREARIRYQKSIDEKVVEIQRLKLQLSEAQEESRKVIPLRKQLQAMEASIKQLQSEDLSKADRLQYFQRIIQNYESQLRLNQHAKEEMILEVKALQRDNKRVKELEQNIISLERDFEAEKCRQARLIEDKSRLQEQLSRQQVGSRGWRQKYEDLLAQKDKTLSNASTRQKELKSQIRQLQCKLEHRADNLERVQSQCDRIETQLKTALDREKLLRIELDQERSNLTMLENKNNTLQKLNDEQKRLIHALSLEQEDKVRQIQILLAKLSQCEQESACNTARQIQGQEIKRAARLSGLEPLARLAGITLIEEEVAIKGVYEWCQRLLDIKKGLEEESSQYRKLVVKLKQQNEILSQKYMKYKSVALQYKERRDREKLLINNTYRFNDEILTHCQNLIKGAPK